MSNKFVLTMIGVASVGAFILVLYIQSINKKLNECFSKNFALVSALNTQNKAIETWKYESEEVQRKIDESSKTANKKYEQIKNEEKLIMDENVPSECSGAIKWSIQKAKEMRP